MSKQASEFQEKVMSRIYRGKEIFKPLNTGRINDHVSCVREFIANIFFYTKGDATLMIDAGYNYPRLKEKMGWHPCALPMTQPRTSIPTLETTPAQASGMSRP